MTYRELHRRVCKLANGLKSLGVRKGDRVVIYMAMSIEAVVAMQACARIGAIHSVVFGGFSAPSLGERIENAGAVAVITADMQIRGGRRLPLKAIVDDAFAMSESHTVKNVIVYQRTDEEIPFDRERDHWMHELMQSQSEICQPEWVNAEHPLFILYTSGSTGNPKGAQHSSGGYLLWAIMTMRWTSRPIFSGARLISAGLPDILTMPMVPWQSERRSFFSREFRLIRMPVVSGK